MARDTRGYTSRSNVPCNRSTFPWVCGWYARPWIGRIPSRISRASNQLTPGPSRPVDPKAVAREDYEYLRGLAWQYTQAVRLARGTE